MFGFSSPGLPKKIQSDRTLVTGILYRRDDYTLASNLYLKHTNLILNSKKYPTDHIKIMISTDQIPGNLCVGARIAVLGVLEEIPFPSNPGQFSERAYYYARKIKWYLKASKLQVLREKEDKILFLQDKIKEKIRQGIYRSMPLREAGILEAMLLGEKGNIEETDKIQFQMLGISHILAISGMHISILGWGLFKVLRKIRLPLKPAGILSAAVIVFYGSLTGGSAATWRAVFMFGISAGAQAAGRTYDFLSAAAFGAILILAENPLYLYDSGFLLSFGAVLGLGMVSPKLFASRKKERKVVTALKSGIALWLTSCPILMYFFYEIPIWGTFVNLAVLPTAAFLLVSGMLAGLLGMIFPAVVGEIMAFPAVCLLKSYRVAAIFLQKLPFVMWITGRPLLWKCGVYYILLIVALFWKWKKAKIGRSICLMLGIIILTVKIPDGKLKITYLDVGQGDCACIQTMPGHGYLIDGGSLDVSKVGKYRILPFLKASGIHTVDGIFLSHMDEDHINGIREVLEDTRKKETAIKVRRLFLTYCEETAQQEAMLETLGKKAGCEIVQIKKGTVLCDRKLKIECLAPEGTAGESNESSQVLEISYGKFKSLFTGDVEGEGEEKLTEVLKERGKNNYLLLKASHHGSKNSTKETFLQQISCKYAVISAGEGNRFGHPHREMLERLENVGIKILKTMDHGAIRVISDGKRMRISFQCP